MNEAEKPDTWSGARMFLAYTTIGLIGGTAIASFLLSTLTSMLVDPSKATGELWFLYVFVLCLMFAALPAVISGVFVTWKFMRESYFRARYAMLIAFLASGLIGPLYQELYLGKDPGQAELVRSILWSYFVIGPIALLSAFAGQRAVRKIGLIVEPRKKADAELGK